MNWSGQSIGSTCAERKEKARREAKIKPTNAEREEARIAKARIHNQQIKEENRTARREARKEEERIRAEREEEEFAQILRQMKAKQGLLEY